MGANPVVSGVVVTLCVVIQWVVVAILRLARLRVERRGRALCVVTASGEPGCVMTKKPRLGDGRRRQ